MPYFAQGLADEDRVAELKRLITSRRFESLEILEDAVDAFLWGTEGQQPPESDFAPADARQNDQRMNG